MVKIFGVEINPLEKYTEETNPSGVGQENRQKRKRDSSCHQCHRSGEERVVKCSRCNRKNYCILCITKWYPGMEEAAFAEACPACHNICNCTACLRSSIDTKDLQIPSLELNTKDRFLYSRHTIKVLLPILKQMVVVGSTEKEEQDKVLEILKKAEDMYELRDDHDVCEGACPHCGSAQGSRSEDTRMLKAACRQENTDNYLYCLTAGNPCLKHFQWHLSRGEPLIAHEVLRGLPGLSWEPLVMWRACRQNKKNGSLTVMDFDVINCTNWCQEKINMHQFLQGYSDGVLDGERRRKTLKLENWPTSGSFRERLPQHYLEFLRCLPFKHYTHPYGCLNMRVLHPLMKMDMGPKMSIGYGANDGRQGGALTKLQYALADRVNVMMHTAVNGGQADGEGDSSASSSTRGSEGVEGSATWDIFRRKDVPMLEDFLRKYSGELAPASVLQGGNSLLDNAFYLTAKDKEKLKKDYGIEPWTFSQGRGDAVFIPGGCPYQIRNLKSCMNIDFISPESIAECIVDSEESQSLCRSRMYLKDQSQVKGAILRAVSDASEYMDKVAPDRRNSAQ